MLDQLFTTPVYRHVPKNKDDLLATLRQFLATNKTENIPTGHSTRGGYQSPPTFFQNKQDTAVQLLRREIITAFESYYPALRNATVAAGAPIPKLDFELWGWVTSYDHHGWNAPHIHPRSLVSGVYWVETPPQILENKNKDFAGWLGFQDPRSGAQTWPLPDTLTHFFVPPEEGMMILFPSYMSHFVPPFVGGGQRTSIAFNLRHKISGIDN